MSKNTPTTADERAEPLSVVARSDKTDDEGKRQTVLTFSRWLTAAEDQRICSALTPAPSGDERESLVRVIALEDGNHDYESGDIASPEEYADAILAAGFRLPKPKVEPRQVATLEELEALNLDPDTVLQGRDNGPHVERTLTTVRYYWLWRRSMTEHAGAPLIPEQDIFPATILTPAPDTTALASELRALVTYSQSVEAESPFGEGYNKACADVETIIDLHEAKGGA